MSAGHGSALLYATLHMAGFDIGLNDLKDFRQLGSITPGHPEYRITPGVDCTTGPLGQGIATAVGMAIAEANLRTRYKDVVDYYTYVLCGDGDLMEGVTMEAASLAGHLKLGKLIAFYDCNDVSMDGNLGLTNRENIKKKFQAMGWNVITVENGNSYFFCTHAIARAKKNRKKPTLIIFKTTIGIGTEKEGTSAMHSGMLTDAELADLKHDLKVKESFYIPSDVRELCMASTRRGRLNHEKWNQNLAMYSSTHPELYKSFFHQAVGS